MLTLLELAILNNVTWYQAVMRAHGVVNRLDEHFWSTDGTPPPYYGKFVSRTRDGVEPQLTRLRELAHLSPTPEWGAKDSHACIDPARMEALGMRLLFDAEWYGRPPGPMDGPHDDTGTRLVPVRTEEELLRWEMAWKVSSPSLGIRVFPPALLDDADIAFHAAMRGDVLVGGAITNRSPGAVGVSNVFALDAADELALLRSAARTAAQANPGRAVVGYDRPRETAALASLGFQVPGPLRVWVAAAVWPPRGPDARHSAV